MPPHCIVYGSSARLSTSRTSSRAMGDNARALAGSRPAVGRAVCGRPHARLWRLGGRFLISSKRHSFSILVCWPHRPEYGRMEYPSLASGSWGAVLPLPPAFETHRYQLRLGSPPRNRLALAGQPLVSASQTAALQDETLVQPRCSHGREPRPAVGRGAGAIQRPRGAAPAVRIDSGPPGDRRCVASRVHRQGRGSYVARWPTLPAPRLRSALSPRTRRSRPCPKLQGSTDRARGGNLWLADQTCLSAASRIKMGNEAVGCVLVQVHTEGFASVGTPDVAQW